MSDQGNAERNLPDEFEQALEARLEEIVDSLESGNVALEESIQIYQRGNLLRLHFETKLKDAQSKIEKITGTGDGEDPGTEPLDRLIMNTPNLETALKHASGLIDQKLEEFLVVPDAPEGRVIEAMKYTLMGGGKRLGAFLCIQTAKLFNVEEVYYARVATAARMRAFLFTGA